MTDGKGLERCYSSNEEGDDKVLGCSVDPPASVLGSGDGRGEGKRKGIRRVRRGVRRGGEE